MKKTSWENCKILLPIANIVLMGVVLGIFLFTVDDLYELFERHEYTLKFHERYIDQKTKLRYNSLEAARDKAELQKQIDELKEQLIIHEKATQK